METTWHCISINEQHETREPFMFACLHAFTCKLKKSIILKDQLGGYLAEIPISATSPLQICFLHDRPAEMDLWVRP
jgi:hypothetical protein